MSLLWQWQWKPSVKTLQTTLFSFPVFTQKLFFSHWWLLCRLKQVPASIRLKLYTKEAILAQGYIRWRTMSWIDMPVYPIKASLVETHVWITHVSFCTWNTILAKRLFFGTRQLMLTLEDDATRCKSQKDRKLVLRVQTIAAKATQDPVLENIAHV